MSTEEKRSQDANESNRRSVNMTKQSLGTMLIFLLTVMMTLYVFARRMAIDTDSIIINESKSVQQLAINNTVNTDNINQDTVTNMDENNNINTENKMNTEMEYINQLLFNNDAELIQYFNESDKYIPLYNINNLRRSRMVNGDMSRLRLLLNQIIFKKKCISVIAIGGSVTVGRAIGRVIPSWTQHLQFWLNKYFPCNNQGNNSIHIVRTHAISAASSDVHFWRLYDVFKEKKYDLVIIETATNFVPNLSPSCAIWNELIIRQLLLYQHEPAIISLQATLHQGIVLGNSDKKNRGDLQESMNLNYYQIPTVSLSQVIYPLSYRYYFNHFMTWKSSTIAKAFANGGKTSYLYQDTVDKVSVNNESKAFNVYHDIRYDFENGGGHLRVDKVHPTLYGQKYISLLIAYLLCIESKNLLNDMAFMDSDEFNLFYRDKLWISPAMYSLPPVLFENNNNNKVFMRYLANYIIKPTHLVFTQRFSKKKGIPLDLNMYLKNYGYSPNVITQNEGKWNLINERGKIGLICLEPIQCKLTINLTEIIKNVERTDKTKLLIAMRYLQSYNLMGAVLFGIDNKPIVDENYTKENEDDDRVKIDALATATQISPTTIYLTAIDFDNNQMTHDLALYLHLMIIDSIPERENNKFKLLALSLAFV